MGIIVSKNNEDNNRLNQRITADLRERANRTASAGKDPDLVEDSDYARDLKKTGKYSWIWIVLIVLALLSLGVICIY